MSKMVISTCAAFCFKVFPKFLTNPACKSIDYLRGLKIIWKCNHSANNQCMFAKTVCSLLDLFRSFNIFTESFKKKKKKTISHVNSNNTMGIKLGIIWFHFWKIYWPFIEANCQCRPLVLTPLHVRITQTVICFQDGPSTLPLTLATSMFPVRKASYLWGSRCGGGPSTGHDLLCDITATLVGVSYPYLYDDEVNIG